jgi:prepilin peptidase CpaA
LLTAEVVAQSAWALWGVRLGVLVLLIGVCISDIRTRRIPNLLVGAGLCLAFAWQALGAKGAGLFAASGAGALGFGQAAGGAVAAFAAFLFLHAFRIMGAGDVKLMAFLGAVFGLAVLPWLILLVFAAGGVLAAVRLFDAERRRKLLGNLRLIAFGAASARGRAGGPRFDPVTDTADRLPFAVAIVAGALLLAAFQWSGRLV